MMQALLGVPAQLDDLNGDVAALAGVATETRLARLDQTISSRAAAATALSNATWTDAKAALVDAAITSRTRIKSIQRGTITITAGNSEETATISSVTTGRCELRLSGSYPVDTTAAADPAYWAVRLILTNATTITAKRGTHMAITIGAVSVGWELTEYYAEGS